MELKKYEGLKNRRLMRGKEGRKIRRKGGGKRRKKGGAEGEGVAVGGWKLLWIEGGGY